MGGTSAFQAWHGCLQSWSPPTSSTSLGGSRWPDPAVDPPIGYDLCGPVSKLTVFKYPFSIVPMHVGAFSGHCETFWRYDDITVKLLEGMLTALSNALCRIFGTLVFWIVLKEFIWTTKNHQLQKQLLQQDGFTLLHLLQLFILKFRKDRAERKTIKKMHCTLLQVLKQRKNGLQHNIFFVVQLFWHDLFCVVYRYILLNK